jgi:hypothetical protein
MPAHSGLAAKSRRQIVQSVGMELGSAAEVLAPTTSMTSIIASGAMSQTVWRTDGVDAKAAKAASKKAKMSFGSGDSGLTDLLLV